MTPQEFIQAIQAMRGLDELMSDRLIAIATKLSGEERDGAIVKLQEANDMIESALDSQIALYKEGEGEIQKAMHTIAKGEERGDRESDQADADSILSNL